MSPFVGLFLFALLRGTYQATVQLLATDNEQEIFVNSCVEETCTYEIQAAPLGNGQYLQAYFAMLDVSDNLPDCSTRRVKISRKVDPDTYKEITDLCSANLESKISNVKFLSFENGIKLEYSGHVNDEGFLLKYQKKSGLSSTCNKFYPRAQRSGTFLVHDGTADLCTVKINIRQNMALKVFAMDIGLPTPTTPPCRTANGEQIVKISVQDENMHDVTNACVSNVQNWCAIGIPAVFATTGNSVKFEFRRDGQTSHKGLTAGFVTYLPISPTQETRCYISDAV